MNSMKDGGNNTREGEGIEKLRLGCGGIYPSNMGRRGVIYIGGVWKIRS
jgi:hypothetical protein